MKAVPSLTSTQGGQINRLNLSALLKKGTPSGSADCAMNLIIFWQQECCGRPVGLGDDPGLSPIGDFIGGEQAVAVPEGAVVSLLVLLAKAAPVAIRIMECACEQTMAICSPI